MRVIGCTRNSLAIAVPDRGGDHGRIEQVCQIARGRRVHSDARETGSEIKDADLPISDIAANVQRVTPSNVRYVIAILIEVFVRALGCIDIWTRRKRIVVHHNAKAFSAGEGELL